MVFRQFHYTKRDRFMPFLLAEILNFQGSTHRIGVGSFSNLFAKTSWHARTESTSFDGRFVRLDPQVFLSSWS